MTTSSSIGQKLWNYCNVGPGQRFPTVEARWHRKRFPDLADTRRHYEHHF